MTYSTYTNKFLRFKAIKTYCSFKCIFCLKYKNNPIRPDCVNLKKSQIETNCRNKTVFVNKCDSLRATWLELKLTNKNHVIFWNHVVFTDVSFTCIGWPQVTSVSEDLFLKQFKKHYTEIHWYLGIQWWPWK